MSRLLEVKEQFEELQNKYQEYLPKVDTDVVNDLLKVSLLDNRSIYFITIAPINLRRWALT